MSEVWDTKDGRRRVRRDPPTVEDAVLAAQGMADDVDGQVEIVVSLMQVRSKRRGAPSCVWVSARIRSRFTVAGRPGAPRAVVVERRRAAARAGMRPTASAGFRGRK